MQREVDPFGDTADEFHYEKKRRVTLRRVSEALCSELQQ